MQTSDWYFGFFIAFNLIFVYKISSSPTGSFKHVWWCSMYNTTHLEMANWWQFYEELPALDTCGTTLLAHQQFSRSFFALFLLVRLKTIPLAENIPDTENLKQVRGGQFVLSELAIRFWSHSHNFFWWSPVPLYIRRVNHWALEHALIQLWQLKLNLPLYFAVFHATQRNHV